MGQHGYLFILRLSLALILLWSSFCPDRVSASSISDPKIVINIPSRTLWLYSGDKIVKYYPVGVGRSGFPTPLGQFKVTRKILNPGWEHPYKPKGRVQIKPGKGNPLGTRWIGFKPYKGGEYGIHGTDRPSSVGRFSSHGCVRMKIQDAEDLFKHVDVGTPVEVIYDLALVRRRGQEILLITYPDIFRKGKPTVAQIRGKILQEYPEVVLDERQIERALKMPSEKPVIVGHISGPEDKPETTGGDDKPEATEKPPLPDKPAMNRGASS